MTKLFSGMPHTRGLSNQKWCPMSHLFWKFNNKTILLHLADVIKLSFPTKVFVAKKGIGIYPNFILWATISLKNEKEN